MSSNPNKKTTRIKQLREYTGLNQTDFAKIIGLEQGAYSPIENPNRKKELSANSIRIISEKYKEIDLNWLIRGEGEMLKNDKTEQETFYTSKERSVNKKILFPAKMGLNNSSNSIFTKIGIKEHYTIPKFKNKKIDFLIEIEGDSMYPNYNSGDIIACMHLQKDAFIQWNKTYVIATKEQGIIVKRIRKGSSNAHFLIVSDNACLYNPFEIRKEDIEDLALVVGLIRAE